jgi:hypothetical protein
VEQSADETDHLRVPIANEHKDRLALVASDRRRPEPRGDRARDRSRRRRHREVREQPDVALVGLGESSEHALDLIDKIVGKAACPVIALLHAHDPVLVKEASKRGTFAHISDDEVEGWQSYRPAPVRGIPRSPGGLRTPRADRAGVPRAS